MWKDFIVEEIRKNRDEYAKQFNYDLHVICQDKGINKGSHATGGCGASALSTLHPIKTCQNLCGNPLGQYGRSFRPVRQGAPLVRRGLYWTVRQQRQEELPHFCFGGRIKEQANHATILGGNEHLT